MDYYYPLDYITYNADEIAKIIDFIAYIEDFKGNYDYPTFKEKYKVYRSTINSIQEEKRIDKEYQALTGVSIYKVCKSMGL